MEDLISTLVNKSIYYIIIIIIIIIIKHTQKSHK